MYIYGVRFCVCLYVSVAICLFILNCNLYICTLCLPICDIMHFVMGTAPKTLLPRKLLSLRDGVSAVDARAGLMCCIIELVNYAFCSM